MVLRGICSASRSIAKNRGRADWADLDRDNATGNQILAPALADGTLVARYGIICRAIRASQLEA
jgi:hypothetical protein